MAPLVAIGLARFSYALLLPAMRAELDWSYAAAGAINTANAAGYLAGAFAAARVAALVGARRSFIAGLAVTALALVASAGADHLAWQMLWRALAGCAGAIAFVVGAGMATEAAALARGRGGLVIATYFGGGGAGILVSSIILPPLLTLGPDAWRLGWLVLAAASLAALAFACAVVPDLAARLPAQDDQTPEAPRVSLAPTYLAYLCFGAGYIGYMTFIIARLDAAAVAPLAIAAFWAVLGCASVASSYLWGTLFTRLLGGRSMVLVLVCVALGAVLPLASTAPVALYGSAVLFGGAVMAMPGAVTVVVKNTLPPRAWTPSLGRLTVAFGLGQCAGPLATGLLADSAAGITLGLLASAGLLVAGAGAAAFQR